MKNFIRILTVFALIVSFPVGFVLARASAPDSSYFPLHFGSEWSLASQSNLHTEKFADTAFIHGKSYFGLTIWSTDVSFWFRCSNDSVFVVDGLTYNDSSESLLYDFSANVGDTLLLPNHYGCSFGLKIILVAKNDTVVTTSGTYTNCFHFKHLPGCFDGGMQDSWFAKGIGRIKYSEESYSGLRIYDLSSYSPVTTMQLTPSKLGPSAYELFDCFPNPFNPQTTLSFRLGGKGLVSLKIVDLLGRQVALLLSEERQAGNYQVVWNAEAFPSGIYFAVLRVNNFAQTKKLTLQK